MGQPSQMTGEVLRAIRESDALIGAGRMLESAERALQNDLLISKEGKLKTDRNQRLRWKRNEVL